ncbi:Mini-ribonuclease 3 [Alkaliphilus peptidifermentans]|uniref:Mini-ribonuclease 3 n=1 Tax=Alkaliphilus peptidifermentans DSM 18978 TaxID=1120976 RepID=A0A1G5LBW2_9FIRM|nr:ribonuclease III domain-containing protein [Alkaliphilus peptidifermentans]SCZ09798.1 ribonuclease-3 family protein [Alkaliphilus peptidifermentans DSM 18978]
MDEFIDLLQATHGIKTEREVKMMAPLVLAYMGDAIFEVFIRNYLVNKTNTSVNILHRQATRYVKAKSQAITVHALEDHLEESEWDVVKKGRNQKISTSPKNAVLIDYKYATGFEALLGYLFYLGKNERLFEIMKKSIHIIDENLEL